jgi:CMP-N,N'-diacetyllegionaminic acid synthase
LSVLAIIPARGGSKGIPRKNLTKLNGIPLIDYTISAVQFAKSVSHILVSSDDQRILKHCAVKNIDTDYVRPPDLASDSAGMFEVVINALDWINKNRGFQPEMVVLLQPTSPLRNTEDIENTLALLKSSEYQSAISVNEMTEHPME